MIRNAIRRLIPKRLRMRGSGGSIRPPADDSVLVWISPAQVSYDRGETWHVVPHRARPVPESGAPK